MKVSKKLPMIVDLETMDIISESLSETASYKEHLDFIIITILYGTGMRRAD